MLRVSMLGLNYAPEHSGIAPYAAGIASGLGRRGHEVTVITSFPHYPQWRRADGYDGWSSHEVIDGVDVQRVRHYVPARPSLGRRVVSEVTFGSRLVGRSWASPDVVLCMSPALISSAMALARTSVHRKRPAVGLIVQDLYSAGMTETRSAGGVADRVVSSLESWAVRRADGVAVIHDRFKERVVRQLGVAPDRVRVIRNWTHLAPPIDHFDRDGFRRALGWGSHQFVVLHTGAMGEKQGLRNVVEAARLADARHEDVLFVLMGDGGQRADLQRQAAGVERIRFVDPLPGAEYGQALRAADMLLVNERPGVRDMAVPSKLTSYFSTGVPVLAATDASSTTAEELAASGAGLRVAAGDPEQLLAGVRWACADRQRASRVGSHGPAYCASVLDQDTAIDGYERWVQDLALLGSVGRRPHQETMG